MKKRETFVKCFKKFTKGLALGKRTIDSAFNYSTYYNMSEEKAAKVLATQLIEYGWFIPYSEL